MAQCPSVSHLVDITVNKAFLINLNHLTTVTAKGPTYFKEPELQVSSIFSGLELPRRRRTLISRELFINYVI
jgi:hypothetical protein